MAQGNEERHVADSSGNCAAKVGIIPDFSIITCFDMSGMAEYLQYINEVNAKEI